MLLLLLMQQSTVGLYIEASGIHPNVDVEVWKVGCSEPKGVVPGQGATRGPVFQLRAGWELQD